ncbi:sensor domain-containing diguanylate cyclase [Arhodomonas sp. SL1]|uniref:sensor domain-containing diguanylate cyclase n=1 Tax=Arhodomonas sp. SL1 TaxID=3425691 RepID=UPI003F885013
MGRRKLWFALALGALVAGGFMATSLISYFVAHDAVAERIAEETLPLTSDNIYSEIQRDLLRTVLISSFMAQDTFVRDWAINGERDREAMIRYLASIQEQYETVTAFFVSERTRRYYHPDGVLKTVQPDEPGDAWYFRVRNLRERYEINVDRDTADRTRLTIFVNYRVLDYEGDYLGAIGVGLAVSAVTDLIETYQRRYGRRVYFVDRLGQVALHGSGFDAPGDLRDRRGLAPHATRILANPSSEFRYTDADGHTIYVNTRLVPALDWHLIVEQDDAAAQGRIRRTLLVNLAIALGFTVLVLTLSYVTVRGYQRRLEAMATTDRLTGAANRQAFELVFEQLRRGARRRNSPVSLLSLDVDHFKAVNDRYGHHAGDVALRSLVERIRGQIREADTIARWGGEEFVILLADCDLEDALRRAERLRAQLAGEEISVPGGRVRLTVSIGVAECGAEEPLESVMQRVDSALYAAKRGGRDRVFRA